MILMEKKLLEGFTKTNCKNHLEFRNENWRSNKNKGQKVINYMLNGKEINILKELLIRLINRFIKKDIA